MSPCLVQSVSEHVICYNGTRLLLPAAICPSTSIQRIRLLDSRTRDDLEPLSAPASRGTAQHTYLLARLCDLRVKVVVRDRALHDDLLLLQADVVRGHTCARPPQNEQNEPRSASRCLGTVAKKNSSLRTFGLLQHAIDGARAAAAGHLGRTVDARSVSSPALL